MAKKIIYGKQCTIVWYVDDNTLSHVDTNVVTDIIEEIRKHFGYLVIIIFDTHYFLGMTIKMRNENKVEIMMKHQIEDKLRKFKDKCVILMWLCHVHIIYGM